jgi:hypothetical protein
LPLALPHPGWKSGTFYLAEKRNFLLCVDSLGPPQSTQGQMSQSGQSSAGRHGFAQDTIVELRSARHPRAAVPTWTVAMNSVVKLLPDVCPPDSRGV